MFPVRDAAIDARQKQAVAVIIRSAEAVIGRIRPRFVLPRSGTWTTVASRHPYVDEALYAAKAQGRDRVQAVPV